MRCAIAWLGACLFVLASAGLPGCSERPMGPSEPTGAAPAARPANRAEVALRVIDEKDLAEALRRHNGEVVLVDFWATWCPGCVELFPHTVQLRQRLGDRGLAVITVSLDSTKQEPAVREFLASHDATTENFQSRFGASDETIERFDLPGAIPYLRLYDRSGKLRETFPSGQAGVDPEDIDKAVDRLLAERG